MEKTYYLLCLGCPKNEVDAEQMMTDLEKAGYESTDDPEEAAYLILNTCAFIDSAKEEALDYWAELINTKEARREEGMDTKLVVTGCLPQIAGAELVKKYEDVDAVLGTADYGELVPLLEDLSKDQAELLAKRRSYKPGKPGSIAYLTTDRMASGDRNYAYLKIAEGCSNACTYCAIPRIRGGQQSRPMEDLVAEAKNLESQGFQELIVVAQDTTRYGLDHYGHFALPALLSQLLKETSFPWIRTLYFYSEAVTPELIDLYQKEPRLVPYIDLPIQHIADPVLKAMHRKDTGAGIRDLITRLRAQIPNLVLRTTVMVGFPGETEEDFNELLAFIKEEKFERLGVFVFSPQEHTLAYQLPNRVDPDVGQARYETIMAAQEAISYDWNQKRIGTSAEVLIDGVDPDGLAWVARSYGEAPNIDPEIVVYDTRGDLDLGARVKVKIVEADTYDVEAVYGEPTNL